MKGINLVIIVLLVIINLAAGAAKVLGAEQEVAFLQRFGFSLTLIVLFGLVQIMAGILLAIPRTCVVGAILSLLAFLLSSGLIMLDGNGIFALVSLLPVGLTVLLIRQSQKHNTPKNS